MKLKAGKIIVIVAIAAVVGIGAFFYTLPEAEGKYDAFAQCLTDNGATFYGAFWCPHCADQKTMFGSSVKHVNYVECSLPNRSGQTEICAQEAIDGYPTWEFSDGSRLSGAIPLSTLSEKTGCELPAS